MIKKRIIFKLLYKDGQFILSRNFNHQIIGDVNWLINNYEFENVSKYLDELIILDISDNKNQKKFINDYLKLYKVIFIPVTIGGGIDSFQKAKTFFENELIKFQLIHLFLKI
jgi:cyclase